MNFSNTLKYIFFNFIIFGFTNSFIYSQEKFTKWQDKPLIGVLFSPDGKTLSSVGSDKTIKIWNVTDGALINTLVDNVSGEVAIAYSPDGKHIVSGSWDKDVKIWDVASGKVISRFTGHDKSLRAVSYHPSGKFIASAGWDKDILIWYEPTGLLIKKLGGSNQCVRAIEYSPDGKYIASGGYDLYLRIHDVATGNIIFSEKAHKYPIEALSYSPDGKYVATGGNDNFIKVWDVASKKIFKTLTGHTDAVYTIHFSPDGKYLASGGNDNSIKIWDIQKGTNIMTFKGHSLTVKSVAFNPNGKLLVSASADKTIRVWDVSSLNINPIPKIKFIKNVYSNNQSFEFNSVLNQEFDIAEREFTFSTVVKDLKFDRISLFLNKKEYVQFNGIDTVAVKPTIKKIDNSESIVEYKMYLPYGENYLQLYATNNNETDIYISNEVKINCIDFDKSAAKSKLYIINFNPSNFADKKISKLYNNDNIDAFCDAMESLKSKIYKDVIISNFNSLESFNPDSIKNKILSLSQNFKSYDNLLISFNGFYVEKNKSLAYLNPNSTLKDINIIYIDSIIKLIGTKIKTVEVINNISILNLKFDDNYTIPESKSVFDKMNLLFNKFNNYFILHINNINDGNPYDIIAKSKNKSSDVNNNSIISIEEINNVLLPLFNPSFSSNKKGLPIYLLSN